MTVSVRYEDLTPGPVGDRFAVIDYDGGNKTFYKPIDLNETGYYPLSSWYEGDKAGDVRVEAWEFMAGGGSSFNNLNAMYTVRDPAGKAAENEPVRKTMQSLKQFIEGFDCLTII